MDKAGKSFWDNSWKSHSQRKTVDLNDKSLRNFVNIRFHELFRSIFADMQTQGKRLLEIGCANSQWLPYFAKEYGFDVSGIDYSEEGCRQARAILSDNNVAGGIVCADIFSLQAEKDHLYDVVISFGVLEHFENTSHFMSAMSSFLSEGGIMITIVPNLSGLIGFFQKKFNPDIYETHVRLTPEDIIKAHEANDLSVLECRYFLFTSFGIINIGVGKKQGISYHIKRNAYRLMTAISMAVWKCELLWGFLRANRCLSPYIICVGKKRIE